VFKSEDLDVNADNVVATAADHIYLGSDGDINIESVKSTGNKEVRIYAKGGIYNVNSDPDAVNIVGLTATFEAAGGTIGKTDKDLILDITGKIVARASDGIFLKTANDLLIDSILSNGLTRIITQGDVLAYNPESVINSAGVEIYADNVGSDNAVLNFTTNQESAPEGTHNSLFIDASGGINIGGVAQDLYLSQITAGGDITISSEKDILQEGVVSIKGANITIDFSQGNVGTSEQYILVETPGTVSADTVGDIYLKSEDPVTFGDVKTSNGTIAITAQNGAVADGEISAYGNIDILVENGGLQANDRIISETGVLTADVDGDINDNPLSSTSGFYADHVVLTSRNGDIGSQENHLRISNFNPTPVLLDIKALKGGYFEDLVNGAKFSLIQVGKDLSFDVIGTLYGISRGGKLPNLIAQNITLKSSAGSIGTEDNTITVETLTENGRVNISAYSGIDVAEYKYIFLSDFVKNTGYGKASIFVPDHSIVIDDIQVTKDTRVEIDFSDKDFKNGAMLNAENVERIVIRPSSVLHPQYETLFNIPLDTLYRNFHKQNIKNNVWPPAHPDVYQLLNIAKAQETEAE